MSASAKEDALKIQPHGFEVDPVEVPRDLEARRPQVALSRLAGHALYLRGRLNGLYEAWSAWQANAQYGLHVITESWRALRGELSRVDEHRGRILNLLSSREVARRQLTQEQLVNPADLFATYDPGQSLDAHDVKIAAQVELCDVLKRAQQHIAPLVGPGAFAFSRAAGIELEMARRELGALLVKRAGLAQPATRPQPEEAPA